MKRSADGGSICQRSIATADQTTPWEGREGRSIDTTHVTHSHTHRPQTFVLPLFWGSELTPTRRTPLASTSCCSDGAGGHLKPEIAVFCTFIVTDIFALPFFFPSSLRLLLSSSCSNYRLVFCLLLLFVSVNKSQVYGFEIEVGVFLCYGITLI